MFPAIRALKNSDYRLYFAGQLLSMSGTFMQGVAQSWLVYRLSGSATWLGIITFCTQAPAFVLSPVAGVWADRFDRRRILVIVQWLSMLQAFALAALVFAGMVQIWHVAAMAIFIGCINAFDMTTRQAFVVNLVEKNELQHAIALNSVIMNGSRIIGPAIAGAMIELVGEKWCFALNGFSYFAALYSLLRLKNACDLQEAKRHTRPSGMIKPIVDGVKYVRKNNFIIWIMALMAFISFVTPMCMVLLPVYTTEILHGGARMFAWLTAAIGLGAVFGALNIGDCRNKPLVRRSIMTSIALIGISLIVLSKTSNFTVALCSMFVLGFFNMSVYPRMNSAIQYVVDDSIRGRVMSLYVMMFLATMPLGSLLGGIISDLAGPRPTIFAGGVLCLGAMASLLVRHLRKELMRQTAPPKDKDHDGTRVHPPEPWLHP
ncbi:MAG: hypothetical protein A2583_16725 [Bdellovibrionales bacterium RIFOXYD1_FULL_53_11]|nr:MAG: hypothetical protein A2583_16725 [Bdellovibrionales bacterium RIFOXYD1_FULL_53_11]